MRKHAWIVVLVAVASGTAIAIIQNKVLPCIILLQEVFSINSATAGWLSSIFAAAGIFIAIPGAMLVNRLGVRNAGLISLLFALIGSLLGVWSSTTGMLMFSRLIEGIGLGLIAIAVPSIISMWFPPDKRGLPMGIWTSWQFVAQALVFLFGVMITDAFGWKGFWWLGAAIVTLCAVGFFLLVKRPPDDENYAEIETAEKVSIKDVMHYRSMWLICLAMFCFNFTCFGFISWAAPSWAGRFGLDIDAANRYLSLMSLWALPIVIAVGFLLDRWDRRRFCITSYLIYIPVVASAFLLPGPGWILPFILVYPIFEGSVVTSLWTIVPQTVDNSRFIPLAVGLFTMMQNAGMLLGPPVTGALIDLWGWGAAVIPICISAVIGAFTVIKTRLYSV